MQWGRGPGWQAARAAELDAELRALGRSDGRLRLELGEALEAMARAQGHHALGFSSLEAYARERCGLGAGVVRQLRTVFRRLGALPRLHRALTEGALGWSMVELLARHATAHNEPFLVALAQRSTVARMRALLNEKPPASKRACLGRTVDAEVAWLFEQTRLLVEAHCGSRANDAVWEALLGEATTELGEWLEGEAVAVEDGGDHGTSLISPTRPPPPTTALGEHPEPPRLVAHAPRRARCARSHDGSALQHGREVPADAAGIDRRCVELARELGSRDLRIAELTLELKWLGGYGRSEEDYAEKVLGMCHSTLKDRHTLLKRLSRLPELHHALEDGEIGMQAASLLARVATQQSVQAWVDRAKHRTIKHLAEEVRLAERVGRLTGGVPAGPPTEEQMAQSEEVERGVLTGQISALAKAPMEDDPSAIRPRQMGRVRLRLRMRRDLAAEYRRLERAWDRAGQPLGDFIRFLCWSFCRAWEHIFDTDDMAYEQIYRRERYKCASPTCERRDLTPHHLVFRSQGGTDDDENVTGLCSWCHLQGIHTWRSIKAEPPATQMTWKTPVMEVRGRDVAWRR